MTDLKSPTLIYLKGWLFLVCGLFATAMILIEVGSLRIAFLLLTAIWCFARFYYFAFYVIQHYVDHEFRFAGLLSFIRYLISDAKHDSHQNSS